MLDNNQNNYCLSLDIRCVWNIVSCWSSVWGKVRKGRKKSSWGQLLGNDLFIVYLFNCL